MLKSVAFTTSGIALGAFLVVIAQSALPNSWLYPLQKLSDSVVVSIRPKYRASVMMKRAQQVSQLVADHADQKQVLAALADYTKEASTYTSVNHTNYAAFEYCRTSLQQAEAGAPPTIRHAIAKSLQSIENT